MDSFNLRETYASNVGWLFIANWDVQNQEVLNEVGSQFGPWLRAATKRDYYAHKHSGFMGSKNT